MKKTLSHRLVFALLLTMGCRLPLEAGNFSTAFADVIVHDVPKGTDYEVLGSSGKGLDLHNDGDTAMRVRVDVKVPERSELKEGAAAIPDAKWVRVEPAQLLIAPHSEAHCQVILHLPRRARGGRLYQVMIWSHGMPDKPVEISVAAGLLSRLRFSPKVEAKLISTKTHLKINKK